VTETLIKADGDIAGALKGAMRGFGQSVVIITTVDADGKRYGMPATAVTPLSMDPPSMLICVNRTAAAYVTLEQGADFCLNILSADQADIGKASAMAKGEDRFAKGQWEADDYGLPCLAGAQTVISCQQRQAISYGSHDIFIGDVRAVRLSGSADPLLYLNGQYHRIGEPL
jgi:flavin reductase (DIM6/NTAB) family NADH-FMN oxidoreductase RutF